MSPENKGFVNREMRDLILEALNLSEGRISEQDLREYVTKSKPGTSNMSISQLLRYMQRDEEITVTGDWIRRKQVPPQGKDVIAEVAWKAMSNKYQQEKTEASVPYTNGTEEKRVNIPDFYKGRQGKDVEIIRGRKAYKNVFRIEYQQAGSDQWQRVFMPVSVVIYTGEMVDVSPEQETLSNVRRMKIIYTDGRVDPIDDLNPREYVTIAPME